MIYIYIHICIYNTCVITRVFYLYALVIHTRTRVMRSYARVHAKLESTAVYVYASTKNIILLRDGKANVHIPRRATNAK